ncbi:MAG: class I SAM-dependent methyltransferase [Desulfatitalea sp.]|nr:class I SAM-dependent methyltransferase [Desulfatitalea sp.]
MFQKTDKKRCVICEGKMLFAFRTTVLFKYMVSYFHCAKCGLIQTETPYWLNEAYDEAISILDTGIVARNVSISKTLGFLLLYLFGKRGRYLDSAGGYGVLTRLMRDYGFDYYWQDPYCSNLFARGFEASPLKQQYNAVTAFEVLEHLEHPLEFIREKLSLAQSDIFIFTTILYQKKVPEPNGWWYYAHESGQHISFYSRKTLSVIAERLAMSVFSYGNMHILSKYRLNKTVLSIIMNPVFKAFDFCFPIFLKPRTITDHEALKNMLKKK